MTPLHPAPAAGPGVGDCWNRIGVHGDRSCPELEKVVHCHNCPIFAGAGRHFLDAPTPAGYLEEWTDRLAPPAEMEAGDRQSVLVFRVGCEWLGLPTRSLVEVTAPLPVRRVPHRGGFLAGLVNVRGELHLCARLDRVLGLPEGDAATAPGRMLVVEHDKERWVFPVDAVDRVHRVPVDRLTMTPPTVGRAQGRLTGAVFQACDRAVGLIDAARLFQALRGKAR